MPGFWDEYEKNTKRAREAKARWDAWTTAEEIDYWLNEPPAVSLYDAAEMDEQGGIGIPWQPVGKDEQAAELAELVERIGPEIVRLSPRPSIASLYADALNGVEVVRPHQIEIMNPRRGQGAE